VSRTRWNVICHLLDGVFFFAAVITFSAEIVIPKMISDLKDSALLLGLVPLTMNLASLLPQTFYAKMIEGLSYKKPTVLLCAFLQRAGWLVFLVWLYLGWSAGFTLPVFFAVYAVNNVGSGLIMPVWTDWYAKTVPANQWGRLLGARGAIPAVLGIALGRLIQWVMNIHPAPQRYRLLLLLAIGFYVLSFFFVMLVKEDRHDGLPNHRKTGWGDYFKDLGGILVRRRDFRTFVTAAFLGVLSLTVMTTFLTKYGLSYEGVTSGVTGMFTMSYFGATAIGSLAGGLISDRKGAIAPFQVFPLLAMMGCLVAALSARPAVVCTAWGLLGLAWGMRIVAMLPAVFHFSGPHRRPTYAAMLFTALGAGAVVPSLLGLAKDAGVLAFPHLFVLAGALALTSWLLSLRIPSPEPTAL